MLSEFGHENAALYEVHTSSTLAAGIELRRARTVTVRTADTRTFVGYGADFRHMRRRMVPYACVFASTCVPLALVA